MANEHFITPKEAAQVEMLPGIYRRTMAATEKMMICEFFLERNAVLPAHSHPHDQVGYVVYGQMEMTVGNDETKVCHQGDSYAIPGGVVHTVNVLVDTLVIDVFSPPRDEYRE